jgi:arabinogalactan oligomer/maltooligosaccharide transport system substrate-binding protein
MKKRIISCLLATSMAGFLLAGCGKAAGTDDTQTAFSTEKGQEGTVQLTFWCDTDELEMYQQMISSFIEEHKGEAAIEVEYGTVSVADCKESLLSDVNNGADVFSLADDQVLTLVASGVLDPVADQEDVKNRNQEGAVDAATVDGQVYAYPITADNGYFLYYDKQYFSDSDVETLDRILEICEENGKTFAMDWSSGWYLYSFFGNTGLELGLNDDGLTNYCNWNSTENSLQGVDVAQAMLDIAANPAFSNRSDTAAAAQEGSAIAFISGVWDIANVKAAYGDNYGACKLPTYTCAGQQVQMASFTGYRLMGVNSYSENKDWAEKLADYLTNEENQQTRFEWMECGPANLNVAASDAIQQIPALAAVLDQSQYGQLQEVGSAYWSPVAEFGALMAAGNPDGADLQEIMDTMVNTITE